MQTKTISLSKIEKNAGQIAGLPANPRIITDEKFELLKKNITDYPEMLEYRSLLVYPYQNRYVIIGGNMRYEALSALGYSQAPCIIIPETTSIEQLRAYTIIDNNEQGRWDWDMLSNEWDEALLQSVGLELPFYAPGDMSLDDLYKQIDSKKDDEIKITIEIPSLYADKVDDIKKSLSITIQEWDGCKIR